MENLIGVVICGGESRRMGRDKGLLLKDGRSWAEYMGGKLGFTGIPVVFSIRVEQQSAYAAHLPDHQMIVDSPALGAVAGPLRGLLSVYEQFPGAAFLLLACDMIDMDEATLRDLMDIYRLAVAVPLSSEQSDDYFFAYHSHDIFQPLCTIYRSEGLGEVHRATLEGRITEYSLQGVLRKGPTRRIPILREEAFRNYNTI